MDLVIFNRGQVTRKTPEAASLPILPHHLTRGRLALNRSTVHQARIHGGYCVESEFKPAVQKPRIFNEATATKDARRVGCGSRHHL
ncbi:hypothetical protein AVEN_146301-1 [Araneus ventricosus]|uniref:Uncharacterized protein n=1 Tax=Araneus ventricosus TaxID=182803 RepID=A0A4Y2I0Q9_ARAVE|nr:hypothetical protein AVEN_146301-1 [Araneus ventricosus]